jgi:hypothetical protein
VSKRTIPSITVKVIDGLIEWQNRLLDPDVSRISSLDNDSAAGSAQRSFRVDVTAVHRRSTGVERESDAGDVERPFQHKSACASLAALSVPAAAPAVAGEDYSAIHSGLNGKCLTVLASNTADGALVVNWTCNGFADQLWRWDGARNSRDGPVTAGPKHRSP